ncbi:ras-related protein Rab-17-like isoform X2 [Genypterus blacodes]|uniref:ras-related protein Rab-17-like isoform X2 n=1 Tax=Genypterus blacodes TaxID=154954 RepID=UPI003F7720AB
MSSGVVNKEMLCVNIIHKSSLTGLWFLLLVSVEQCKVYTAHRFLLCAHKRPLRGTGGLCCTFSVLSNGILSFYWSYFILLMGEILPVVPRGARLRRDTLSGHVQTLRVKMVLLGSSGVGKSSLALRFGREEFRTTSPTEGSAYLTRVVHMSNVTLRFEIWDTAGQDKYHSVTPLYYRGAHAALLVYDISKQETFVRAQVWLRELEKQYIPGSVVIWLVGNKGDLDQNRQVSVQEGETLANDRGLFFTETSALTGHQVSELLLATAL